MMAASPCHAVDASVPLQCGCPQVIYTELAILNQTTLNLEYYTNDRHHNLMPTNEHMADYASRLHELAAEAGLFQANEQPHRGDATVDAPSVAPPSASSPEQDPPPTNMSAGCHNELRAERLHLICPQGNVTSKTGRVIDRFRLRVSGVSRTITRNQQLDLSGVAGAIEGHDVPRLCEPHEQLHAQFVGAFSTPISTSSATNHGVAWLSDNVGVLGVETRIQAQVPKAVPFTTIVTIKPRFMVVNQLGMPVQYYPTHHSLSTKRSRVQALEIDDLIRPPSAGLEEDGVVVVQSFQHTADAREEELQRLGEQLGDGAPGAAAVASEHLWRRTVDHPSQLSREQLRRLPVVPPNSCTPLYGFDSDTGEQSMESLNVFVRVAASDARCSWSRPMAMSDATTVHFFARDVREEGLGHDDASTAIPRVVRVSIRDHGATVFLNIEDASDSPPCAVANRTRVDLWFAVWDSHLRQFLLAGHPKAVWHRLQPGASVPVLWHSEESGGKAPEMASQQRHMKLAVTLFDPSAALFDPFALEARHELVYFDYAEMYRLHAIHVSESAGLASPSRHRLGQPDDWRWYPRDTRRYPTADGYDVDDEVSSETSECSVPPTVEWVYGRVAMAEGTRVLSISRDLQPDEELPTEARGLVVDDSIGSRLRLGRELLPSYLIAAMNLRHAASHASPKAGAKRTSLTHARRWQGLLRKVNADAVISDEMRDALEAEGSSSGATSSWWLVAEMRLHGISVALIDSAPKELLQFNLRRLRLEAVSNDAGAHLEFRVGVISADNLLPDNFNPVVISSISDGEAAADGRQGDAGERMADALEVVVERRTLNAFRDVSVRMAPLKLVLDLSLLKALSTMSSSSEDFEALAPKIDASPRLRATFEALRVLGITPPDELLHSRKEAGQGIFFQRILIAKLRIQVTVAMTSTYVQDPKRELLALVETIPHVPRFRSILEPLLPVLSNLASITEATFELKPFARTDAFATPADVARDAANVWAAQLVWELLWAITGSGDMLGNPLGFARRVADSGSKTLSHFHEGVKTRNKEAFEMAALEALHGCFGGAAETISRFLRSVHGCFTVFQLTTAHNRRLVARERPRDISQGLVAFRRVWSSTMADAWVSLISRRRRCCAPQLGLQALCSCLTGLLGGTTVLLYSIDRNTRRLTGRREMQRSRPPRLFSAAMPRLMELQDRMVVRLRLVLESVGHLMPLGFGGQLIVKVQLVAEQYDPTARGVAAAAIVDVIESHTTRAIDWPAVRVWEEVITLAPDALDDIIVLQLLHRPSPDSAVALVGEGRLSVWQVRSLCGQPDAGKEAQGAQAVDTDGSDAPAGGRNQQLTVEEHLASKRLSVPVAHAVSAWMGSRARQPSSSKLSAMPATIVEDASSNEGSWSDDSDAEKGGSVASSAYEPYLASVEPSIAPSPTPASVDGADGGHGGHGGGPSLEGSGGEAPRNTSTSPAATGGALDGAEGAGAASEPNKAARSTAMAAAPSPEAAAVRAQEASTSWSAGMSAGISTWVWGIVSNLGADKRKSADATAASAAAADATAASAAAADAAPTPEALRDPMASHSGALPSPATADKDSDGMGSHQEHPSPPSLTHAPSLDLALDSARFEPSDDDEEEAGASAQSDAAAGTTPGPEEVATPPSKTIASRTHEMWGSWTNDVGSWMKGVVVSFSPDRTQELTPESQPDAASAPAAATVAETAPQAVGADSSADAERSDGNDQSSTPESSPAHRRLSASPEAAVYVSSLQREAAIRLYSRGMVQTDEALEEQMRDLAARRLQTVRVPCSASRHPTPPARRTVAAAAERCSRLPVPSPHRGTCMSRVACERGPSHRDLT